MIKVRVEYGNHVGYVTCVVCPRKGERIMCYLTDISVTESFHLEVSNVYHSDNSLTLQCVDVPMMAARNLMILKKASGL
jgi:hypothetical protein